MVYEFYRDSNSDFVGDSLVCMHGLSNSKIVGQHQWLHLHSRVLLRLGLTAFEWRLGRIKEPGDTFY